MNMGTIIMKMTMTTTMTTSMTTSMEPTTTMGTEIIATTIRRLLHRCRDPRKNLPEPPVMADILRLLRPKRKDLPATHLGNPRATRPGNPRATHPGNPRENPLVAKRRKSILPRTTRVKHRQQAPKTTIPWRKLGTKHNFAPNAYTSNEYKALCFSVIFVAFKEKSTTPRS